MNLIIDLLNAFRWLWVGVGVMVPAVCVARWMASDIAETVHELID